MRLSEETIKSIREHKMLKLKLAAEMDKSIATIYRWLDSNDPMLTTKTALTIIAKELNQPERKLLTN